jgi:uncharacterized membrane protein
MNKLLVYGILAVCIVSGAFAQVLFKMGLLKLDGNINIFTLEGFIRVLFNKYILIGAFLYALAFFLWLLALSKLELSLMYPLLSLAYIITTFLSAVVLGERVNPSRWVGVILIVIGAILVGLNK